MKTRILLITGIVVSTFAIGFAAQVATKPSASPQFSPNATAHITSKLEPQILRIKSDGEVIAELRLFKPSELVMDGLKLTHEGKPGSTTKAGSIEIAPDGLSPWRISGSGLEVEVSNLATDEK